MMAEKGTIGDVDQNLNKSGYARISEGKPKVKFHAGKILLFCSFDYFRQFLFILIEC